MLVQGRKITRVHYRTKTKQPKGTLTVACKRKHISGCRLSPETSESRKYVCFRRLNLQQRQLIADTLFGPKINHQERGSIYYTTYCAECRHQTHNKLISAFNCRTTQPHEVA